MYWHVMPNQTAHDGSWGRVVLPVCEPRGRWFCSEDKVNSGRVAEAKAKTDEE